MSFLGGSGERAGEALRLKLSTPLNVSELLLNAAEQILLGEEQAAEELSMAVGVKDQLEGYRVEMIADAAAQRRRRVRSSTPSSSAPGRSSTILFACPTPCRCSLRACSPARGEVEARYKSRFSAMQRKNSASRWMNSPRG